MAALLIKTSIPPISRTTPSTWLCAEIASATSAPKSLCGPRPERKASLTPPGRCGSGRRSCALARELSRNLAPDAARGACNQRHLPRYLHLSSYQGGSPHPAAPVLCSRRNSTTGIFYKRRRESIMTLDRYSHWIPSMGKACCRRHGRSLEIESTAALLLPSPRWSKWGS